MNTETTLHSLIIDELRDLYHAERQLVKASPKLAKAVTDDALREALEAHLAETEEHVTRLEKAPYRTSKCVGAGMQMQLLHEVCGDFELTIDHNGARSPGGTASAEVTFEDAAGRSATVTATGSIVPGTFSVTYPNPPISWACSK